MSIAEFAVDALSALLVAVPTAYLTVRLSLKRFYKEKWWESKRATYMTLLEALHHLKKAEEEWYWWLRHPHRHSDPDVEELGKENRRRYGELEKLIDLAPFQLGDEAVRILQTYIDDRVKAKREDPDDVNGLHGDALARCLESLKLAARRDLNIQVMGYHPLRIAKKIWQTRGSS